MSSAGAADVIFCIDSSASMAPCIDGVRRSVGQFVEGLASANYSSWDLRLDLLAYQFSGDGAGCWLRSASLEGMDLFDALYRGNGQDARLFPNGLDRFGAALRDISVDGDENTLFALDTALDFPWRAAERVHRAVVILTDEGVETGVDPEQQIATIPALIEKIAGLRIALYIVAPQSDGFEHLAMVDRAEYDTVEETGDGLAGVDFGKLLFRIGRSISTVLPSQATSSPRVKRALFAQDQFRRANFDMRGR